jgi:meiosis induction protein kinase IME2/SME1
MLSLSPTLSPTLSPSPPWGVQHDGKDPGLDLKSPPYISIQNPPSSPMDMHTYLHGRRSPHRAHSPYSRPLRSGHSSHSAKSAINPIFKVVSADDENFPLHSTNSLFAAPRSSNTPNTAITPFEQLRPQRPPAKLP